MPLTAQELLNQRLERDKAEMQRAFEQQWDLTNRRFGPATNNPRIEEARQRALSSLDEEFTTRAQKLLDFYSEKAQGQSEIQQLVKEGRLTPDAGEEAAQRMLMPPEVEKRVFPEEQTFEQLEAKRATIRNRLERFELGRINERGKFKTEPARIKLGPRSELKRGLVPWPFRGHNYADVPAQGLYIKEKVWDEKEGKYVEQHRPATKEEMQNYARLKYMDVSAARMQTAAWRSSRMLNRPETGQGTFAEKAVPQRPKGKPIYARNSKTGERIVSYDGGQSWQQVR